MRALQVFLLAVLTVLAWADHFYYNTCHDMTEVDKDSIDLPDEYKHFGKPWKRFKHSKVFESPLLGENWKTLTSLKVRGLNDTVEGLLRLLEHRHCLPFIWGGSVRDSILGHRVTDIDIAVTCNPHSIKRICSEHYGYELCKRPHEGSSKLTIGGPEDDNDTDESVEPVDVAHWNTSFEVFGSQWEFSPNTLAVYFDGEGFKRPLIIDLSGNATDDVCRRRLRIPTKSQYWMEWAHENTVNKLYRFWKLRSKGFDITDETQRQFLVETTKQQFSRKLFLQFFCHGFLDGTFDKEAESCNAPPLSARKQHKLDLFKVTLRQDLGDTFYEEKVEPLIDSTMRQLNEY